MYVCMYVNVNCQGSDFIGAFRSGDHSYSHNSNLADAWDEIQEGPHLTPHHRDDDFHHTYDRLQQPTLDGTTFNPNPNGNHCYYYNFMLCE